MTRFLSLVLVSAPLILTACGPDATRSLRAARGEPDPQVTSYQEQVAADAMALAGMSTPFQARILRDGKVTFAEYRRSTRAMIRCLRSAAVPIRVASARPAPGRELEFDWYVEGRGETAFRALERRAVAAFERCHNRYERDVKTIYSNQRVIPPKRRPAVLDRLVACLRGAGVRVTPDRPSMKRLIAILGAARDEAGARCAERYADFFRMPVRVRGR